MTRFIRQPTQSSCGPTAIINCIKWSGYRCSIRSSHTFISRLCNTTREEGTDDVDFGRVLRRLVAGEGKSGKVSVWKRDRVLSKQILEHVKNPDCVAVVLYYFSHNEGHYALVTDVTDQGVVCVNALADETISIVEKKQFTRYLSFRRKAKKDFPRVWFLRRKV